MGMNYYAHLNVCACCGRPEKVWHICKSMRTYRAYTYDGPGGFTITEAQHWWPILRADDITVVDEDGSEFDAEEFIADCLARGPRRIEWDERLHGFYRDPQGFVMRGEFQ